ncbi:MAG: ATP phosphoribosyltransferase [Clostridia bacterium]|nr:ATP phosphoribosyltransferase [Clostridia bacterium]
MEINEKLLDQAEKYSLLLRELYFNSGYKPYKMTKFEEYDLYADNKEFLVSDDVITFTDTDGKLMALKPDVTLSIIKNGSYGAGEIKKVFYSEKVYRATPTDSFKEITQTGLECFGDLTEKEIVEVITLAAESLTRINKNCILDISDVSVVNGIIKSLGLSLPTSETVKAVSDKNFEGILSASVGENKGGNAEKAAFVNKLINTSGKIDDVLPELKSLLKEIGTDAYAEFISVLESLSGSPLSGVMRVDFSVSADVKYYNGIVFRGFIKDIPTAVLSGGQYDRLMKKLSKGGKAIGFAVYLDALKRSAKSDGGNDGYINVALPKGRLGEKVYSIFAKAGYECPSLLSPNRKLIFTNEEKKVRYFWVKPSDVTIYVERGAADLGVAGKDTILEYEPDVYELLDLKEGVCKMAVASTKGYKRDDSETVRVATKFPNIAKKFYAATGRNIDVINLHGSIEIAPILGLSDVIVDIVETGATLRENDLTVIEDVCPISARLIANKASSKFKGDLISALTESVKKTVNGK